MGTFILLGCIAPLASYSDPLLTQGSVVNLSDCVSVCVSLCLSVTFVSTVKTAELIEMPFESRRMLAEGSICIRWGSTRGRIHSPPREVTR